MQQGGAGDSLPRKLTAVGTVGQVGASYTVFEKNWICKACGGENYARRERCSRCRGPKTASEDSIVIPQNCNTKWREALDPESGHIYYYHTETNETSWERPTEMGPAPHCNVFLVVYFYVSLLFGMFCRIH